MTQKIPDMNLAQFCAWLQPIVNVSLFARRERLVTLLSSHAAHEALEEAFRDFFEGYCGLAFELENHEECLLGMLDAREEFAHLKRHVAAVEAVRKASPLGQEARRMGGVIVDYVPEVKVAELSAEDFRILMEQLVHWELFTLRERMVKLMCAAPDSAANVPLQGAGHSSDGVDFRLQSAFFEFFVSYLELEQCLEDYEYDSDDGLELRPEVAAEFEQSIAERKAGAKTYSLEEVLREFEGE